MSPPRASLRPARPGGARGGSPARPLALLLTVGALALLLAATTEQLHGWGRVSSRFAGSQTGGSATRGGVRLDIDPLGDWITAAVQPGHTLLVMGYSGEPALRVDQVGIVEHNENATLGTQHPDDPTRSPPVAAEGPVLWTQTGVGGVVQWHDHRAHWYGGTPSVADGTQLGTWTVTVAIDGSTQGVPGELVWEEPSAVRLGLASIVAAAVAALVFPASSRRTPYLAPAVDFVGRSAVALTLVALTLVHWRWALLPVPGAADGAPLAPAGWGVVAGAAIGLLLRLFSGNPREPNG